MKKSRIALVSALGVLVVIIIATMLIVKHNGNGANSSNGNEVKVSNLVSEKKSRLWFDVSDATDKITRNTPITTLYVTNNGRIKSYTVNPTPDEELTTHFNLGQMNDEEKKFVKEMKKMPRLTLGKVNSMSDKEIIKKATQLNKDYFKERQLLDKLENVYLAEYDDDEYDEYDEYADGYGINNGKPITRQTVYKKPIYAPLKIAAYNDGTSKDVIAEEMTSKVIGDPDTGETTSILWDKDNEDGAYFNQTIDKVNYSGWSRDFMTKLPDKQQIVHDTVNDKLVQDKGEK